jgi:hypothetical protein
MLFEHATRLGFTVLGTKITFESTRNEMDRWAMYIILSAYLGHIFQEYTELKFKGLHGYLEDEGEQPLEMRSVLRETHRLTTDRRGRHGYHGRHRRRPHHHLTSVFAALQAPRPKVFLTGGLVLLVLGFGVRLDRLRVGTSKTVDQANRQPPYAPEPVVLALGLGLRWIFVASEIFKDFEGSAMIVDVFTTLLGGDVSLFCLVLIWSLLIPFAMTAASLHLQIGSGGGGVISEHSIADYFLK